MGENLKLKDCDAEHAEVLINEIGKVRCWLTGFSYGRSNSGSMPVHVAGEDALRQIQIILRESISASQTRKPRT